MNKSDQELGIKENIQAQLKSQEEQRRKIRFEHSLQKFVEGDLLILKNDEFLQGLTLCFGKENFPEKDTLNDILEMMVGAGLTEDYEIRKRALPVFFQAATFFTEFNQHKGILCILTIMLEWLKNETETMPGAESITKKIEECIVWLLKNENLAEAEDALTTLNKILVEDPYCSAAKKAMINKTLKKCATDENLKVLTTGYLRTKNQKELYLRLLVALQPDSVFYLLDLVAESDDKAERATLVNMISGFGSAAIGALESCLKSKPNWAVVRNIIYIIGQIGGPENYRLIEQYHGYNDERVQLETVSTTIKLGGEDKRKRLINALLVVNERLKLHILRLILEDGDQDEELYDALKKLISQRATFSFSVGTELLASIITAVKMFPLQETVNLLEVMKKDYAKGVGGAQVILIIDEAISSIRPKIRHGKKSLKGNDEYKVEFDYDPEETQAATSVMHGIEVNILKHLRMGDKKGATIYIYEQAIAATNLGNFAIAEKLRDRLLEVNPLALTEVVKLGEVIDGQRTVSITPHHIDIWQDLYERMTTKQFNALYYNCFQENYTKGDIIVNNGEIDNCLYFLNSGTISLSCESSGNEIFLKKINPGEILGAEHFFSASVWTVSLTALSAVQVNVLDQEKWKKVLKEAPELEEKLEIFCQRYEKIADLVRMSGDDRRMDSRHPLKMSTRHILLDPFGQKSKRSFRGDLIDLSRGGIAFTIKLANLKTAKTLLGRQILSYLEVGGTIYPEYAGLVVGVRVYDALNQTYSIHVKLAQSIDEADYKSILKSV